MNLFSFLYDPFMQMALLALLLSSLISGTIGSFVVIKRIVFIAGSISHSILAGMGAFLFFQKTYGISFLTPILGAFTAAIGSAILIGWIHLHHKQREDTVIAAIWSTGMAIGIIFLSMTPGNNAEIMDFLFGNILWTTPKDLLFLGVLDLFLFSLILLNYRKFLAICFDEEQAILQGISTKKLYLLLLSMIAVTIVILVQIVGTILVIALLTIPSTFAGLLTQRLPFMIFLSTLFSSIFSLLGLSFSYVLDWPPGATIALFSAVCYLLALFIKKKAPQWTLRKKPSLISS